MNDHVMTEDQTESYNQWITLWKWGWLIALGSIIYAFITPTFGEDSLWIFAVFVVNFFGGTLCKGFADDVKQNFPATAIAICILLFMKMQTILIGIAVIIIFAFTGV